MSKKKRRKKKKREKRKKRGEERKKGGEEIEEGEHFFFSWRPFGQKNLSIGSAFSHEGESVFVIKDHNKV